MKPLVDAGRFGPWSVVTGSSSGIGEEIARLLAASGLNIVLVARREDRLDRLGRELEAQFGIECRTVKVDLSAEGFMEAIESATGSLDVGLFVGNAGVASPGELWTLDRAALLRAAHLKVDANLALVHHFAGRLVARGRGGILLTSSVGGLSGIPYVSATAAAEAYVLTLGEGLHHELKRHGVHVTVLMPGPTRTESMKKMGLEPSEMALKPMSPVRVAEEALRALHKNRPTRIAGRLNRIMSRLMSRSVATSVMGAMIGRRFAAPTLAARGTTTPPGSFT